MAGPYAFPRVLNGFPVDADAWYNAVATAVTELGAASAAAIPQRNFVSASQNTTSTTYTDLSTVGPTITLTVGPSGVIVLHYAAMFSNAGGNHCYMAPAFSGANTVAADDERCVAHASTNVIRMGVTETFTGLTPGATTITMKYRVGANTGSWSLRALSGEVK